MNDNSFGSNTTTEAFGSNDTNSSCSNSMMTVSCLDVYSHSANSHSIPTGTSIDSFFKNNLNISASPKNFIVKINGANATSGQVLQPGDSVQITPTKIQGGC
tara:strand:- start:194 stop:499 length:306 start_codon:yes stop_codon:yes gene_type:complete